MARDIDEALGSFQRDDYTVRLCRALCGVVPFAPDLDHYGSLAEAVKTLSQDARQPVLDAARALTAEEGPQKVLWMANAIDTADTGISAYSGLSSAIRLAKSEKGKRLDALETDTQQAADAVIKALALAYMVHKLFPGNPLEKVQAFRATKAGQALAFYFAVVEVGIPFADNALVSGGSMLADLYARFGPDQTKKLAAVAGDAEIEAASGVMAQLVAPIDGVVKMASGHLAALSAAVVQHLPGALDVGDKVAGVVATGADVLPVYRYLGSMLVAETCASRAVVAASSERAAASGDPALVPVKYTVTTPDKDAIEVPANRRRGCLRRILFFLP